MRTVGSQVLPGRGAVRYCQSTHVVRRGSQVLPQTGWQSGTASGVRYCQWEGQLGTASAMGVVLGGAVHTQ